MTSIKMEAKDAAETDGRSHDLRARDGALQWAKGQSEGCGEDGEAGVLCCSFSALPLGFCANAWPRGLSGLLCPSFQLGPAHRPLLMTELITNIKHIANIYSVSRRSCKFQRKGRNRISGTRIDAIGLGADEHWRAVGE